MLCRRPRRRPRPRDALRLSSGAVSLPGRPCKKVLTSPRPSLLRRRRRKSCGRPTQGPECLRGRSVSYGRAERDTSEGRRRDDAAAVVGVSWSGLLSTAGTMTLSPLPALLPPLPLPTSNQPTHRMPQRPLQCLAIRVKMLQPNGTTMRLRISLTESLHLTSTSTTGPARCYSFNAFFSYGSRKLWRGKILHKEEGKKHNSRVRKKMKM